MTDLKGKRVVVTGGAGFLGSAVVDELRKIGVTDIVVPRSADCDLRKADDCRRALHGANVVIHCAANVGGIGINADHSAEMFYDNAMMGMNVIHQAKELGLEKVTVIGTACSYPTGCALPFKEEDLWNGIPTEATAPYAMAKKMLISQAEAYRKQFGVNVIHLLLVNLYGPRDDFDAEHGQVVAALIHRMIEAQAKHEPTFSVWGSGKATRDFLFVRDAATAIVDATEKYDGAEPVNLGSGKEISIADLVRAIQKSIGYYGEVIWDASKPDGQLRRVVDISRAKDAFGFKPKTQLHDGLKETVYWYLQHRS